MEIKKCKKTNSGYFHVAHNYIILNLKNKICAAAFSNFNIVK